MFNFYMFWSCNLLLVMTISLNKKKLRILWFNDIASYLTWEIRVQVLVKVKISILFGVQYCLGQGGESWNLLGFWVNDPMWRGYLSYYGIFERGPKKAWIKSFNHCTTVASNTCLLKKINLYLKLQGFSFFVFCLILRSSMCYPWL